MRAAAILGPGNVSKYVERFKRVGSAEWTEWPPTSSTDADVVVIFGGDGTIHRHLAQLIKLGLSVLVVPCGSGNDFARALKLRSVHDSLSAWRKFVAIGNNVRTIDLGLIREIAPATTVRVAPVQNSKAKASDKSVRPTHANLEHYFCCVAGAGIDTEIARRCNALPKWFRAHGGYALCAPGEFLRFKPPSMKIAMEHDGVENEGTAQPTILAAFANAPAFGGGMKIAPHALLDDGRLDVCIVRAMNRAKLFGLFPTVYFGGHLRFREIEYAQTETARLETGFPIDVYADGEYVCQTPVEFSVARDALRVIIPD
jgi:diacylglycerol kinase (ATP)